MNDTTTLRRKRMNFMISISLIERLQKLVPPGERSDFVNEALEKKLTLWGRQKAFEEMDKFRKDHPLKLSHKKTLKILHDGRKGLL